MLRFWLFAIVLPWYMYGSAQVNSNPYNLPLIQTMFEYERTIDADSSKLLVPIQTFIPTIQLDIKYATKSNVFYMQLYKAPIAMGRLKAVLALAKVQASLASSGLGLKIYDGYRPYAVTVKMFEMIPDTVYMGLPWKGSRHNRGTAFDLTLVELSTGKELKMPTPFDALVYASHPSYEKLPQKVIENRELLKSTMKQHGFVVDPVEWWHYNFIDGTDYELLDLDLEAVLKYYKKSRRK